MLNNDDKITKERIQFVPLEVITYNSINKIIDAIIAMPEQIIELLRCPECGGQGRIPKDTHYRPCLNCNGTGIRLPEKTDQVTEQVEKSCGNCKHGNNGSNFCESLNCGTGNCLKDHNAWQPIEQSDYDVLKQELDKPPEYNEKLAEALKRPLSFEKEEEKDEIQYKFKISQLQNTLAEKDKEISDLKIQAKSLSAQFERAEMFRGQLEEKDKEIEEFKELVSKLSNSLTDYIKEVDEQIEISKELEAERDKYREALMKISTGNPVFYCWGFREAMELKCKDCEEKGKCPYNPLEIAKEALGEG